MSISRLWVGPFANGGASAFTPVVGGAYVAGDSLIEVTGEYIGSQVIATPGSWVRVSQDSAAKQTVALLHTAASSSETIPSITWGTGAIPWAIVLAYRGLAAQASVLDITRDRVANSTSGNLFGPSVTVTPAQSNSLVLFVAQMNKTSVTNAQSYTPPAGFSVIASQILSGTKTAVVICEQIQTAISAIPANTVASGSINETVAQSHQGVIIVLKPGAVTFAPYPSTPLQTVFHPLDVYE